MFFQAKKKKKRRLLKKSSKLAHDKKSTLFLSSDNGLLKTAEYPIIHKGTNNIKTLASVGVGVFEIFDEVLNTDLKTSDNLFNDVDLSPVTKPKTPLEDINCKIIRQNKIWWQLRESVS